MIVHAGSSEMTVIYDGAVSKVSAALPSQDDLWLTLTSLEQVSRVVLKPAGACLDELCVPIPKAREQAFLRREGGTTYFNLSELARVLGQPTVHDDAHAIWLFGARPDAQSKVLNSLDAPNFMLSDWTGQLRSLSDFRGKKVLLITWASW